MPVTFGDFTWDESRRQLLRKGEPVHLSPKAFQLLSILIEERPSAVSKKDLQERLWPDRFVSEGNLTSAVAELRSALGDDRREGRFIRTLYGFGYAFAAVTGEGEGRRPNIHGPWRNATLAATALVLIVILSLRSAIKSDIEAPAPIRTLAVLPFDATGTDRADQHLGVGLPDLLITRLSNVRHLIIRPTSAVRGFAARGVSSLEAGRTLGADAVLEGSIRTTPDRVRVTVQLLNIRDQKTIWGGEFDQKRSDVFMIEDTISEQVADALMIQLSPGERMRLTKRYTTDSKAYELYMQASYEGDQFCRFERRDLTEAIGLLEQAVQRDPSYAIAWADLAQFYGFSAEFAYTVQPQFAYEKAKAAANRALQLDDELSEAHSAAGFIKMCWDLDYAGAERELVRALELNPRNWKALITYGRLVQCLGRFDEAIAVRKRHVEIDPLNPTVHGALAAAYLTARKDDLGVQECQLIVHMDPNISQPHAFLARIYTVRGEYDKAIAEAREAVRTDRDYGQSLQSLALLGYALGMSGRKDRAREILRELESDKRAQPYDFAIVHLALGHRDEVFRILEKAVDDRTYVVRLKTEPIFEPLHSDPRFQTLLKRAGFSS